MTKMHEAEEKDRKERPELYPGGKGRKGGKASQGGEGKAAGGSEAQAPRARPRA